jgi:hypothetical protein
MNPADPLASQVSPLVSAFSVATMLAMSATPAGRRLPEAPPQGAYSMDVLVDGSPLSVYTAKGRPTSRR